MGAFFSRPPDVAHIERIYDKQLQRQIVVATNAEIEREALKLAHRKQLLLWEVLGVGTFAATILVYSGRAKNKLVLLPIVPLVVLVGFHADQTTADFSTAIRKAAADLLADRNEAATLRLVGGPITLAELNERRARWKRPTAAE
ncbi:hypothetical protein M3Y99_00846000 [Aphelenchoides fujianensis]|nr:hypothetical protein M3Y99_00846000 [Aphelenchoides fujianensis]